MGQSHAANLSDRHVDVEDRAFGQALFKTLAVRSAAKLAARVKSPSRAARLTAMPV